MALIMLGSLIPFKESILKEGDHFPAVLVRTNIHLILYVDKPIHDKMPSTWKLFNQISHCNSFEEKSFYASIEYFSNFFLSQLLVIWKCSATHIMQKNML